MNRKSLAMEKRADKRHRINTPIICSYLSAGRCAKTFDGQMKNCCSSGLCVELRAQVKAGTILVVRTTGSSCGFSRDEGFHNMALAQVKWAKQKSIEGEGCYATGLKYVFI